MLQIGFPVLILVLFHQFVSFDAATLLMLQWGLVGYVFVHVIVLAERRKANRRMDLLFRLMQHELATRQRIESERSRQS